MIFLDTDLDDPRLIKQLHELDNGYQTLIRLYRQACWLAFILGFLLGHVLW